ncbi:AAA domain-containing protein [Streptacidiphilus sp. MAP5-3]|uniref:AAA domain-containing protein n=1 Tax=unclassified Streptacidiphilus TaxID=2643834 RepID=UPI0035151B45
MSSTTDPYGASEASGTSAAPPSPGEQADAAVAAILRAAVHGSERGTVVDSPPGAGKSTLVVRAARELAGAGERLMIVAQTNSQVDDLVDRLAEKDPGLAIGRLHGSDATPAGHALRHPGVVASTKVSDLRELPVVVATAAKWQWVKDVDPWRHAIVDEAYQMRSDALLAVARLFERALFVGDPGQLDPFSIVDADAWAGLSYDPSQSAVVTLLAHNPGIVPHRLPVSWRLPASAAPLISDAFYPFTPFRAGTGPGDRRLLLGAPAPLTTPTLPGTLTRRLAAAADEVLDVAAASGWGLLELPPRHTVRTDPEAVAAVAAVVARLLARGGSTLSERGEEQLTADRVAVGTAHRDQASAVRAALAALGVGGVTVDTANRLQGREYDVTVVLHPLSGRPDATAFHLETGRLCVLTSRHRHACVVVARAGIPELLDEHPSAEPVQLGVTLKFPDGWEANQAVLEHLGPHRVRCRP